MRRAKIRPSINLSASRRSVAAAPASKPKETTAPKPEPAAESKPGLRSASNPPASQLEEAKTQASQEKQVHEEQRQQDAQSKQQQQQHQQHQQQQQQQQHDHETEKQDQETDAGQSAAAEQQQAPAPPPDQQPTPEPPTTKPTLVSPPKPVPSSPSKATPDSPTKSANVRRKRITAVPNLGQPRLRPGPNLPTKPRPKLTPAKEKETATRGAGAVQEAAECQMGPPQQPPPVQRVISSTAPTTPGKSVPNVPTKEPPKVVSKPQESQSKPQVPPVSQINHAPTALTTPSRPLLSRTDSVAEKHPVGSENIYEKKLRELKDRMDSETPSRRRHHVKKKVQPPERSKMTMSDLIYFNPKTSPMKNTAGSKEKKFPRTIITEHVVSANNSVNNSAHNSENEDDDDADDKEEDVDPFAPQVKIGLDGSIVLDSSSLVKDASPAKTLHLNDNDIIQEESSHTTYASFRKRTHTTAWREKDTAKFYRALSAVGTDFTMINAMFPNRTRLQIKNKFKREERVNRQRLDKAIRDRQHFDMSLFKQEASSDSETENHVDQRAKGKKGRPKTQGPKRGRGKAKGKTKNKMADGDFERDSDEESVNTEVGSKGEAPDIAKDAALEDEAERDPKQDAATRQSDGSDEEVSIEAILGQPTRSGRQPKFKMSFTVEEPQRRKRGPYSKNPQTGLSESLGVRKANTLAQKLPAKDAFPPYTPGGLQRSPLSYPAQASTSRVMRLASGSPLVRSVGGSRGMTSPGNRGISTITTPMGRFVVSVPQQPANHQGGASPRPIGTPSPQVASPSEGSRKAMRSHIFVISSPDGTQNIIQVPVQPDPSSAEADQQQSSGQTLNRPSGAPLPRSQNPMTTPRILRTASKNLPRSPMVIVHQVPAQSSQQHVTSSPTDPTQSHSESSQRVHTSQVSGSPISMPVHGQRPAGAQSTQCQQIPRPLKREHSKPVAFLPPSGSKKVIILSPHAQQQVLEWTNQQPSSTAVSTAMQSRTTGPTVIVHNQNTNETQLQQVHQDLVSSPVPGQPGQTCVSHHSEYTPADAPATSITYDPAQKVSHMTSDTNTDWLLRDEAVVHEVDIPTTDYIEEVAETDEPFIPPSNLGRSPLQMNESDQVIMSHVTEEHLTAQDILEQMTYEQGVEGDVGANMEVAINEEIITQIATEMTVE